MLLGLLMANSMEVMLILRKFVIQAENRKLIETYFMRKHNSSV